MQDKPSKFITRLTAMLKERTDQVDALTRTIGTLQTDVSMLSDTVADRQRSIDSQDLVIAQSMATNAVLIAQVEDSIALVEEARAVRESALTERNELTFRLAAAESTIADLENQLADASRKAAEVTGRSSELDRKEADIRALVSKVESRMRDRERQESSAIMNRKAMAGAVPRANRR